MFHRVLIVAAAEGFIVKGLEAKLSGIGISSIFSTPKMSDIEDKCGQTDLVIIFTDETVSNTADAFVYIKDKCSDNDEQVVVIGTREEYEKLTGFIPETFIYKLFERPLDMDEFINEMENYMEDESAHARKKSILIVDDDVSYMSMISDWLKDKYRVSMANSGMHAITWLAKNRADLILLDYEMPVTPGPKVLEMIRSDPGLANVPVMFLTGKGDKESIMKVLSLKPVGYQLKTIKREELRKNIADYFDSQKGHIR